MRATTAASNASLVDSHTNQVSSLPRLRTPRELHEQTGVPVSTWYTLIARGDLPAVRIGRSVRLREPDVVTYLESRTSAPNKFKTDPPIRERQLEFEYATPDNPNQIGG